MPLSVTEASYSLESAVGELCLRVVDVKTLWGPPTAAGRLVESKLFDTVPLSLNGKVSVLKPVAGVTVSDSGPSLMCVDVGAVFIGFVVEVAALCRF